MTLGADIRHIAIGAPSSIHMLSALHTEDKGSRRASGRQQGISDKLRPWRNSIGTRAVSLEKAVEASAHTTRGGLLKQPDKHKLTN